MIVSLIAAMAAQSVGTPAAAPVASQCDRPVLLVVLAERSERSKLGPYRETLRRSGLVERNGGVLVTAGAPVNVLEGHWPADRDLVIQRYPCAAAAERLVSSTEYQSVIRPLRAGTGDYTLVVMPDLGALPARR